MPEHYATFVDAVRSPCTPSLFSALEQYCAGTIGHLLFSCSEFQLDEAGNGVAARVYSSDEENYPISGLKEIVANRWTTIVIDRHETFVANSIEGIQDVFPDHEKIASLGLGSVINLPVVLQGQLLGTVNMLHEAGYYTDDRLARVNDLYLPSLTAFQSAAL